MNIELKKEQIKLNEMVNQRFDTVPVTSDVIVPDTSPDIKKILQVDGRAFITGKNAGEGRVALEGRAEFTILYLPDKAEDESPVKSMRAGVDFGHTCEMDGISPDAGIQTECDIDSIDISLINSRKITITGQIGIGIRACRQVETELVADIEADEEVQTLCQDLRAHSLAADEKVKFTASDRLEVPNGKLPMREVLKIDARATGREARAVNGKLVVGGVIDICTLYLCDAPGMPLEFMEHEMSFSEILDVEGIDEGMDCELDYKVCDIYFETGEDSDGDMRILGVEITLEVWVKALVPVESRVIADCYCPGYDMELKKESLNLESIAARLDAQTGVRERLALPEGAPPISQVYNIIVKPYIENAAAQDGKVVIGGVLHVYVLYLTGDPETPIYSFKKEIDFNHSVANEAAAAGMQCESKVAEADSTHSLPSENEVDLRVNLKLDIRLLNSEEAELVTGVEAEEAEEKPAPSIRVCFVQSDNTLWEIAKKYKVSPEKVKAANSLEGAEVSGGMCLIIP